MESELFGYEKGAFTGAAKQTKGKIEYADGGTFFLDEVGDLSLPLQAKLLRFLQERTIERLGGRAEIPVDIRVLCATHQDLLQLIVEGRFREDLYYRISEITVNIPPLRERNGAFLESELFGYEKGAFTGAAKQTKGKIEYADGGTFFLDEVGDLSLPLQAKLLRFLQERTNAGMGIGVFETRQFVEQQGGHIEVQSQLEQGTKFTLKLPLA